MEDTTAIICGRMLESIEIKKKILQDRAMIQQIGQMADRLADALDRGRKLLVCGNGGSASDALHFVGELVGRFQKEREAWSAIALNANVSTMTAIANDYGYEEIFARQVGAFARSGDILMGISTSGNSENVLRAVEKAAGLGIHTFCLLGNDGGKLANLADISVVVPSSVAARVQEAHIAIIHILCEIIEEKLQSEQI